jgi:hypothetical protein
VTPPEGEVTEPETPTEPTTPAEPGTGTVDEAALATALADAKQALSDREAAYAANDLVAAAEADNRLTAALTAALAASGE